MAGGALRGIVGRRHPLLVLVFAAACGSTPAGDAGGAPDREPAAPPDARALERETLVRARAVRIVMSERWHDRTKLEALRTEAGTREGVPQTIARGAAVLRVGNLRVETTEILEIRWMEKEHDNFLLHARDVAVFSRKEGYDNRTENVAAATMANETVHFFQQ